MITGERSIFIGAHLTADQKEQFKIEAERRHMSMSALISEIIEEWLVTAPMEQIDPIRSNKRSRFRHPHNCPEDCKDCRIEAALAKEQDVELPFEE